MNETRNATSTESGEMGRRIESVTVRTSGGKKVAANLALNGKSDTDHDADQAADQANQHGLGEKLPQHVVARSTDGHAEPDLPGPLRYGDQHDVHDADSRDDEGDGGDDDQHDGEHSGDLVGGFENRSQVLDGVVRAGPMTALEDLPNFFGDARHVFGKSGLNVERIDALNGSEISADGDGDEDCLVQHLGFAKRVGLFLERADHRELELVDLDLLAQDGLRAAGEASSPVSRSPARRASEARYRWGPSDVQPKRRYYGLAG